MTKNKIKITPVMLIANIVCILITFSCIYPLFWMFISSLKSNGEFLMDSLSLPKELLFNNYIKAMELGKLAHSMFNSSIYVIVNIFLTTIMAFITSFFVNRFNFKGKNFIRATYLIGMLIPLYALLVPVFVQYRLLDLLNNRLSLIITYYAMCMPLSILLFDSFIQGISPELDNAAIIDGCSITQLLFKVIFPLCTPIIGTVAIMVVLNTWNEFAFSVILTPRLELRTVSVALRAFSTGQKVEYTFLMSALCCATLPVIFIYLLFSKHVIKGMTAGAIKG